MRSRPIRWKEMRYEAGIQSIAAHLPIEKQTRELHKAMCHVSSRIQDIKTSLLPRLNKQFGLRYRNPDVFLVALTLDSTSSPVMQSIEHLPPAAARENMDFDALLACGEMGGRLAFLGDAILEHHVSMQLWAAPALATKGLLTDARKQIVSNANLSRCFDDLGLIDYIIENVHQQHSSSMDDELKGRVMEAMLASFFIAHGMGKPTRAFLDYIRGMSES